ncbi:MAG: UvrD-helicase domain-containing protein [Deferrisomatales bacterium]
MAPPSTPEELRRELNPAQWEAVRTVEGPLLVLAGAGSGKTRVLTYRIAYLVRFAGVPARRILALTFTNKAAREMGRRVEALLGSRAEGAWIGTFHGVCLRILRTHGARLPAGRDFTVYDAEDQKRLAAAVVDELGFDPKRFRPAALLHRVMRAKDEGIGPDRLDVPPGPLGEALRAFYERYQEQLRRAGALDFGDLLLETVRLLREDPEVGDAYRRRFSHLLIDEYQDTNRVQYWLAREIAAGHGNLCVVGDDDQSIYGWRGADLRNILSFEEDFPGARVITLEQNYRSTPPILEAAGAVVSRNVSRHPKRLWTARQGGEPVEVFEASTEEDEAAWIADRVLELAARGAGYGDVAVLYRIHALSRPIEEALLRRQVPYAVYGGLRFYDRKEVKDALSYLRFVLNPDDPVSFRRIVNTPPRGIGKATLEAVERFARERSLGLWEALRGVVEEGALPTRSARAVASFVGLVQGWREAIGEAPLREFAVRILEESGYAQAVKAEPEERARERLQNLEELLNAAEAFEAEEHGGLPEFLDRAALVSDLDQAADRAQAVTLMTLHSAKGLEFPVVFLAGLEEGVFPHLRSSETPEELEEERRLCYVGITRARDRLYLTRARVRRVYGAEGAFRPPSRFLAELPPGVYRRAAAGPKAPPPPPAPDASSGRYLAPEPGEADYRVGMQVRHPRYGAGAVVRVEGRGPRARVTVAFDAGDTRKFLAAMAGLEVALEP